MGLDAKDKIDFKTISAEKLTFLSMVGNPELRVNIRTKERYEHYAKLGKVDLEKLHEWNPIAKEEHYDFFKRQDALEMIQNI